MTLKLEQYYEDGDVFFYGDLAKSNPPLAVFRLNRGEILNICNSGYEDEFLKRKALEFLLEKSEERNKSALYLMRKAERIMNDWWEDYECRPEVEIYPAEDEMEAELLILSREERGVWVKARLWVDYDK